MPSISVNPATIPAGGTTVATVAGLQAGQTLVGKAQLVQRSNGAVAGEADITVQVAGETVGLESNVGTTYFVRPPNGFTATQGTPTTFQLKHNG